MTREGFTRYVETWAKEGVPFMAYWWPKGYSMIRTGEWTVPAHVGSGGKVIRERQKRVPSSILNKWTRLRDKLRKHYYGTFLTVTYDGTSIAYEEADQWN